MRKDKLIILEEGLKQKIKKDLFKSEYKIKKSNMLNFIKKKKTILITGASGFIGGYLSEKFSKKYNVIGVDMKENRHELFNKFYLSDITNPGTFTKIFNENRIDIVIHSAAEKQLIWCENNRDASYKSNFLTTKNLYKFSKRYGSKFVFISSDQVFDGKKGGYSENSDKHPINHYGTLKDLAEEFLLSDKNVAICRTALVFGNIPKNQKSILIK